MQKEITPEYLASQGLSETFPERFWKKVVKTSGCWKWKGSKAPGGYGQIGMGIGRSLIRANRASWVLHNGPIPDGLWVLHKCDNPECTRPDHLWVGTRFQNTADMIAKGRNAKRDKMAPTTAGERHYRTTLNWKQVRKMRHLFSIGHGFASLAERFHVGYHCVWQIIRNKCWDEKFAPHG